MTRLILTMSLLVAAVGCYSEEPNAVYAGAGDGYAGAGDGYAGDGAPGMVAVDGSPGVQVIADYDYPVFYADNFYWRYDGGLWYRSPYYNRGWGVSYNVPYGVRRIDRPYAYAHYRPSGYVARGGYRGGYRGGGVYRGGGGYRGPVRGGVQSVHSGGRAAPSYRPARAAVHSSGGRRR